MANRSILLFILALTALTVHVPALNNGVARSPPMGWSSWDTFRYNVTDSALRIQAQKMIDLGLAKAGYNYILIDDGWMACAVFKDNGGCDTPAPRDSQGRLVPDPDKFPNGMNALTDFIHSLGLKIGIYTAVSATTCGGFPASLGHEAIDGATFADWGFDFVKHDTCNYDCGIHDGCLQNSTMAMSNAILASGKPIVYYIDDGNNSSGMRIWNPFQRHADKQEMIKIATKQSELVWEWGPSVAHMWKLWFDIHDEWYSTLDTIHRFRGIEMYQTCGNYNHPDMLTIGSGGQTFGQYRAQFFLWVILGAPLFLDCNLDNLNSQEVALLTHQELLQIDQDPDCVQGSFSRGHDGFEVYVRPLSDGTFAAVLLNTLSTPQNGTIILGQEDNWGDFYPADVGSARVRDVFSDTDLGTWDQYFFAAVDGYDARFFRIYPSTRDSNRKPRRAQSHH